MNHRRLLSVDANRPSPPAASLALFAAWLLTLVSTLSVLFVGEVMGQEPCLLCWYQRAFMFPLVIVLGIAAARSDSSVWIYALPLAGAGWLLALYHNLLYFAVIPEAIKPCGAGPSCSGADMTVLGALPLPSLSLAVFTLLIILLLTTRRNARP
ncbi:disulfide bond formation protein B [Pseudomonas sp. TE50-2]|uniref:disulfide bond formation protein B n=1 Tax=Pseudomonas sp. TE50-2 TaxID=3142707 RepID=UPI003466F336